jgi:dTDP-4-dehydrorhamnose reductase
VLWAGDLLRDREEPLFVDQVHYGPTLARDLARFVARELARSHESGP